MKKILVINDKPYIRTITDYAFPFGIISGSENVCPVAAEVVIENFRKYQWENALQKLSVREDGDRLEFYCTKYATDMNGCYYRTLHVDNDEISLRIDYQQYSEAWGAINVFISDLPEENMMDDDRYLVRLGNFSRDGIYMRINNREQNIPDGLIDNPVFLRLTVRNGEVQAWAGNGREWKLLSEGYELGETVKEYHIGFQIKLNSNAYYAWLFSNFIQLETISYDKTVRLDYSEILRKDWKNYITNYFLNYSTIPTDLIKAMGVDNVRFIKESLIQGNYVELYINLKYVKERREYLTKDHFHQVLIHGFDDEEKVFYLLGVANGGTIQKQKISYPDMEESMKQEPFHMFVLMRYCQDYRRYRFHVEGMVEKLRCYVYGRSLWENDMYSNYPQGHKNMGLNIYDELATERGLANLLSDNRIAFLLTEHKKCMKDRIEYLCEVEVLSEEEAENVLINMNEIVDIGELLLNMILKIKVKGVQNNPEISERIRKKLLDLKEKERECYTKLLEILEEKIGNCVYVSASCISPSSVSSASLSSTFTSSGNSIQEQYPGSGW